MFIEKSLINTIIIIIYATIKLSEMITCNSFRYFLIHKLLLDLCKRTFAPI